VTEADAYFNLLALSIYIGLITVVALLIFLFQYDSYLVLAYILPQCCQRRLKHGRKLY